MFLEHQLDEAQSAQIETHLNDCLECRQQLELMAAGREFWMGVSQKLKTPLPTPPSGDSLTKHSDDLRPSNDHNPHGTRIVSSAMIDAHLKQWLSPTDDPDSMGRLGTYEIVGIVGVGGMSVVLKGFDRSLNRYVAIKVLGTHLAASGAARTRFAREAQAAAAVVHENVLAIHAIEDWMDLPYLVMPFVRGESLEKRIEREGQLEVVEVLRIGQQIASGLNAAHAQGLIHRDIKPANILLDAGSERLKIADFGLARAADDASLTHSGSITGTPLYMSPEQARGESVDQRSDQFSFGSLLYTLCVGHSPFRAETAYGIIRRICEDEPRPIRESNATVPEWLEAIIEKMMAKDAAQRFGSLDQVADLFMHGLTHVQQPGDVELSTILKSYVPSSRAKSGRLPTAALLGAIGLFAVLAIALVTVALTFWNPVWKPFSNDETHQVADANTGDPAVVSSGDNTSGSQQAERQPVSETANTDLVSLSYKFQADQEWNYRCELKIRNRDYDVAVNGLIRLTTQHVGPEGVELRYGLDLVPQLITQETNLLDRHALMLRETEKDEFHSICQRSGSIKLDRHGKITKRSAVSNLPGEIGPLLDWVFPVLVNDATEPWSQESIVDASVYRLADKPGEIAVRRAPRLHVPYPSQHPFPHIDQLGPFGRKVQDIVFTRKLEFTPNSNQGENDRLRMISFSGFDTPVGASRRLGVEKRECTGSIQFDAAMGRMTELNFHREAEEANLSSGFQNPEVELSLTWLDPDEASAYVKERRE